MFVTFCPYGGAIFRSLEIVDENDVINVVSIVLSLFMRFSSQHLLKHWDFWSLSLKILSIYYRLLEQLLGDLPSGLVALSYVCRTDHAH